MTFEVILQPDAVNDLDSLRRYEATWIVDAIEEHLTVEPEKVSRSRIKRLRGKQPADYRLRVRDYRVFYTVNVEDGTVVVLRILHKTATREFYRKEEP